MTDLDVYFATNRNYQQRGDNPFFGEEMYKPNCAEFRVGRALVARRTDGYEADASRVEVYPEQRARQDAAVAEVLADPRLPPELARREARRLQISRCQGRQRLGSKRLFEEIRGRMRDEDRDLIVFIHGFANSFENSLERAAQLRAEYLVGGAQPLMLCFSWPSNGDLFPPTEYHDDRDDAELSGKAIARLFLRMLGYLRANPEHCERRIHLVAHSMGAWALRRDVGRRCEALDDHGVNGPELTGLTQGAGGLSEKIVHGNGPRLVSLSHRIGRPAWRDGDGQGSVRGGCWQISRRAISSRIVWSISSTNTAASSGINRLLRRHSTPTPTAGRSQPWANSRDLRALSAPPGARRC